MRDQFKEIFYQVVTDTLEALAFIFSFPEDQRDTIDYDSALTTSVSFTGPFSGKLVMAISKQVVPGLAANMLGVDEETSLPQQQDALKEVVNVICGNFLPTIAGEHEIFTIDVPGVISNADQARFLHDGKPTSVAKIKLESGQADFYLFIDGRD